MIIRKPTSVGTLYEQMREKQMRVLDVLFTSPEIESLLMQPRIVRCRIKVPVPNPLSEAVRSNTPWSNT